VASIYPVASKQTQKELVRLLVLEHGQKVASELSEVPYETVRKWTQRGNWLAKSQSVPRPVQTAVNNVQSELAEAEHETRLSLARSTKRMAKDAEQATLRNSGEVYTVAKTASIVHKWDQKSNQANVVVNVALLGIDPSEVRVSG
jgi:hypothetical protein